jgi:hypothetical protein
MREIRMSGSEGGGTTTFSLPLSKLNSEYSVNPSNYHHPNLSLASGATALGSVKPRHLSQVQTEPLPSPDMFLGRHGAKTQPS